MLFQRKVKRKLEIKGRTLVNLLGKYGNFEVDSNGDGVADGWFIGNLYGSIATLSTVGPAYGTKAQRITSTVSDTNYDRHLKFQGFPLFQGRYYIALVDLLTDGTSTGRLDIVPTSSTFSSLSTTSKLLYCKFSPQADSYTYSQAIIKNQTTAGIAGWVQFDGLRLYEITDSLAQSFGYANALALYNALGTTLTDSQVAQMFPYVDSVQFKASTMVTCKNKNLIPPFTQWDSIHPNAVINSDYSLTLNATASTQSSICIVPINHSSIIMSIDGSVNERMYVDQLDRNYTLLPGKAFAVDPTSTGGFSIAKDLDTNCRFLKVQIFSTVAGTFTFTNPMITLVGADQTFAQQIKSQAHCPLQLAAGESVYITPTQAIYKQTWQKNVPLDGSLGWSQNSNLGGYREFRLTLNSYPISSFIAVCTKYNGGPLNNYGLYGAYVSSADSMRYYLPSNLLLVSVADTDSGFPSSLVPSSQEVQAYFYGWKMCASDGSAYVSGTKYWKKITDGTGITSTCPTASYAGFTPYMLHYQLANPVTYYNTYNSNPILSNGSNMMLAPAQIEQKTGIDWSTKTDQANKYASTIDIGTAVDNPNGGTMLSTEQNYLVKHKDVA